MGIPVPPDGDAQQGVGAPVPRALPKPELPDERDWEAIPGHPLHERNRVTGDVRLKPGVL